MGSRCFATWPDCRCDAVPYGERALDCIAIVDFIGLIGDARLVLTDLEGVQEETTVRA